MIAIYEYIQLPLAERQQHLTLDEECLERGGFSSYFKGLLAHVLGTSIPTGKKIHVCHACNNEKCSNPNHLYWGTSSENALDRDALYGKTIWDKMVEKYGLEEARAMNSRTGNKNGTGNKGKPKSEEHKRKIAENRKGGRQKKNASVA
jgi:hypothetical protein